MTSQNDFNWLSPLGFSVICYLLYGFLYILIGTLTPFFLNKPPSENSRLIMSYRTDKEFFGDEPQNIIRQNIPINKLSRVAFSMIAGLFVLSGIFIGSIAWYGLRNGQMWSLMVLAIAGIVVLPFWWLVFKPYWEAGIRITLADAPPFIWVPIVLYLPAVILGWIGLK